MRQQRVRAWNSRENEKRHCRQQSLRDGQSSVRVRTQSQMLDRRLLLRLLLLLSKVRHRSINFDLANLLLIRCTASGRVHLLNSTFDLARSQLQTCADVLPPTFGGPQARTSSRTIADISAEGKILSRRAFLKFLLFLSSFSANCLFEVSVANEVDILECCRASFY